MTKFVELTQEIKRKAHGMTWWVRHRTTNRHHIINISGMDGYTKGWIDRDNAMYLACFKLLCEFVELEDPGVGTREVEEYLSKDSEPAPGEREGIQGQVDREKEVRALYTWWTQERPAELKRIEGMVVPGWRAEDANFTTYCDAQDAQEAKDEEMLMRLMKIRKSLWT